MWGGWGRTHDPGIMSAIPLSAVLPRLPGAGAANVMRRIRGRTVKDHELRCAGPTAVFVRKTRHADWAVAAPLKQDRRMRSTAWSLCRGRAAQPESSGVRTAIRS